MTNIAIVTRTMSNFNMPAQIVSIYNMHLTTPDNFMVTTPVVLTYDNHFKSTETFNVIRKPKFINAENHILTQPMARKQRRMGN